jgi:hypothetical protein
MALRSGKKFDRVEILCHPQAAPRPLPLQPTTDTVLEQPTIDKVTQAPTPVAKNLTLPTIASSSAP